MIVTQHSSPDLRNRCKWCGAKASGDGLYGEELTCVPRNDHFTASEMRPEPARRQMAADDFAVISGSINRIRLESEPRCPLSTDRKLHECLRSAAQCSDACPFKSSWIGPHHDGE